MCDYATMEAGAKMDALVAEKVMGWTFYEDHDQAGWKLPNGEWAVSEDDESRYSLELTEDALPFSTEVQPDYTVLELVRGTWSAKQLAAFRKALWDIWRTRQPGLVVLCGELSYLPGDYTRAALMALEAGK